MFSHANQDVKKSFSIQLWLKVFRTIFYRLMSLFIKIEKEIRSCFEVQKISLAGYIELMPAKLQIHSYAPNSKSSTFYSYNFLPIIWIYILIQNLLLCQSQYTYCCHSCEYTLKISFQFQYIFEIFVFPKKITMHNLCNKYKICIEK